jgi:outer membrane protein TolC
MIHCRNVRRLRAGTRIIGLLVLLGTAPGVWGQNAPPGSPAPEVRQISIEEAVQLALQNNLQLKSAQITIETRRRAAENSWSQFIPSMTLGANMALPNATTDVPANPLAQTAAYTAYYTSIGLSFQAQLALNVAMFEAMHTLELNYQGGLISYEKARVQMERDVRKSYYNMLLLQENIKLLRQNFQAAEDRVVTAQTNYRAGLVPELTLLQAQVAVENMRPQMAQVENGLHLAMANFANNLGLPYDTPFELEPLSGDREFIDLDVSNLIAQAVANHPDLRELQHSVLLLFSRRKATFYQNFTPNLIFGWSYTPSFRIDLMGNGANIDDWKGGAFTLALSFSLNNLFPFGSGRQGLMDMDDTIRTTNNSLAQLIRGTEIQIYNSVLSLNQTVTSAQAQSRTVEMAERSYRLTQTAYRAGAVELLDVQSAELQLQTANNEALSQKFSYITGLIDLEYAIGVPFGTLSDGTLSDGTLSTSSAAQQ